MDSHILVYLFHIIIVAPLFIYVAIKREKNAPTMYSILFYFGIFIIFYHTYKVYNYMKLGKGYWVNLIHIFIVGPVLIYIGYNREKTTRLWYEILLLLGFAALGYHGYYLTQSLK